MVNRRNYYRILQVQPDAPSEIIRTSYRTLMRDLKNHPDLGGDHWTASVINEAYETLSNRHARDEYDRKLLSDYLKQVHPGKNCRERHVFDAFHPFQRKSGVNAPVHHHDSPYAGKPHSTEKCSKFRGRDFRSVLRIKKGGDLRYYSSGEQTGGEVKMLDLSPKGVRFISDRDISRDSALTLECHLFRASAVAANSKIISMNGKISYSVGARFLSVTFTGVLGLFYSVAI